MCSTLLNLLVHKLYLGINFQIKEFQDGMNKLKVFKRDHCFDIGFDSKLVNQWNAMCILL